MKYLWVDALCILQGNSHESHKDWEHESRLMHDIYRGACVTVAAAKAGCVTDGIFQGQYAEITRGIEITLSSELHPEYNGKYRAGDENFTESMYEPLYKRGWTLQERILSRRVLIYNSDQIAWECQTAEMTESGKSMHSLSTLR